jgi:hypothetical protein
VAVWIGASSFVCQVNGKLYKSILEIFTQKIIFTSAREELFSNFRLSHRGAIRKPPNAITWVCCLERLQSDHGECDAAAVLRVWNTSAPKASQIVGVKAMAVKNVMTSMNGDTKLCIIQHVDECGWENSAWTEECLSSKKIFPPYAPRGSSKAWNERQKITEASCKLMVSHVQAIHMMKSGLARRPTSKMEVEDLAIQAAVACALATEVKTHLPISETVLEDKWLSKFASGDSKVTSELAMALADKADKFVVRDIPTLAEIMDTHSGVAPVAAPFQMQVDKSELERSMFDLNLKQLEYDLQAWKVLDTKLGNYSSTVSALKTDWRLGAWKENLDAAATYFQNNALVASWEQDDLMHRFSHFKANVEKKLQLTAENMV